MVTDTHDPVEAVRHFTRFYTGRINVLGDRLLESDFSLPEARVIFELGHCDGMSARDLADMLGLDPGYLSRLLNGLKRRGIVTRSVSEADRRRHVLALTDDGRSALDGLQEKSRSEVSAVLEPLGQEARRDLVSTLRKAENLLGGESAAGKPVPVIRPHRVGELSWALARQAMLYEQEYGWDGGFELTLLKIGREFLESYNPDRGGGWPGGRIGGRGAGRGGDGAAQDRLCRAGCARLGPRAQTRRSLSRFCPFAWIPGHGAFDLQRVVRSPPGLSGGRVLALCRRRRASLWSVPDGTALAPRSGIDQCVE